MTEQVLAHDSAADTLLAVHDLGVRLALDDFGMGWSSLGRLAALPVDLLKIDASFVQALDGPEGPAEQGEQVIRSTIAMAHALGIRATAEGVETTDQLDRLAELGCDIAQGYLFARPTSARDAIDLVSAEGRWTGQHPEASRL